MNEHVGYGELPPFQEGDPVLQLRDIFTQAGLAKRGSMNEYFPRLAQGLDTYAQNVAWRLTRPHISHPNLRDPKLPRTPLVPDLPPEVAEKMTDDEIAEFLIASKKPEDRIDPRVYLKGDLLGGKTDKNAFFRSENIRPLLAAAGLLPPTPENTRRPFEVGYIPLEKDHENRDIIQQIKSNCQEKELNLVERDDQSIDSSEHSPNKDTMELVADTRIPGVRMVVAFHKTQLDNALTWGKPELKTHADELMEGLPQVADISFEFAPSVLARLWPVEMDVSPPVMEYRNQVLGKIGRMPSK